MALKRCITYVFDNDPAVDLERMTLEEASSYIVQNAKVIVIYDILSEDEDTPDLNVAQMVSVHVENGVVKIHKTESGEKIPLKEYDELPMAVLVTATEEVLWSGTVIPMLCEEFTTEELNDMVCSVIEVPLQ